MPQDHAPLARLRRTIQRQTLLQPRAEFHESRERKNATLIAPIRHSDSHERPSYRSHFYAWGAMRALLGTEFAALLARAAVPPWAAALAVLLQDASPAAIQILLEEVQFRLARDTRRAAQRDARHVSPRPDSHLAYHPDKGGSQAQMARTNAAYATARPSP
jgi:hypothetical protein